MAIPDTIKIKRQPAKKPLNKRTVKIKRQPAKKPLNKRTVEALAKPGPGPDGRPSRTWTYDGKTPRLAICVWSSGAKTWYWVGRANGRPIRHKLGEYPEISPEQARKLASKVSLDVAGGHDPRQERRQARTELTLADLFDRYLEQHAKVHKRTWAEDEKVFGRYCQKIKGRTLSTIWRPTSQACTPR